MTELVVTAHRWDGGWELHRDGDPITQVATLDRAPEQVRDYLDTIDPTVDHGCWTVIVIPQIGDLASRVAQVRKATSSAADLTATAARQTREVVRDLRAAGYSVTDTAAILGVSRARVSQLANG